MSKRFVDTAIWTQNKWFRTMAPKYKLLWYYLIPSCDPVGVWEEDLDLAAFIIGESYDRSETLAVFGKQVKVINGGKKWWITGFCRFQYGELQEGHRSNRPHQSYIAILKAHSLWIDYGKTMDSPKEQEQDKDKDKEQDFSELAHPFDAFWNLYDKKREPDRCKGYWSGKRRLENGTRMTDADRAAIMAILPKYIAATPDKQYRKDPGTYLYNSAWLDKIVEHRNGRKADPGPDYKLVN